MTASHASVARTVSSKGDVLHAKKVPIKMTLVVSNSIKQTTVVKPFFAKIKLRVGSVGNSSPRHRPGREISQPAIQPRNLAHVGVMHMVDMVHMARVVEPINGDRHKG